MVSHVASFKQTGWLLFVIAHRRTGAGEQIVENLGLIAAVLANLLVDSALISQSLTARLGANYKQAEIGLEICNMLLIRDKKVFEESS